MIRDFPQLFTGLGAMKDEYNIKLKDGVPMPLYAETKNEIQRMLKSGVITPVDHPTDWCAPVVVTPKPSGKVRVCVDLTKLNKYVQRENHSLAPICGCNPGKARRSEVLHKARCKLWVLASEVVRKLKTTHNLHYPVGSLLL